MSFKYIAAASKLHDRQSLSNVLAGHERALTEAGGKRIDGAVADGEKLAFVFVQTGGVESEVDPALPFAPPAGQDGPLLLIAHAGPQFLGRRALEILAQVQQENGRAGSICCERPTTPRPWGKSSKPPAA
jgi:hypothetical protein